PGVAPGATPQGPAAEVAATAATGDVAPRPALLTRRAAAILQRLEHMMDDATRALASSPGATNPGTTGTGRTTSLPSSDRFGAARATSAERATTERGTNPVRGN